MQTNIMDARQCWEDLKKTAKCRLCSATLNEPRTLPCLHSFCLACLDELALTEGRRFQSEINCPTCMSSCPIPEGNTFDDLPTSYHLDRFKDILAMANGNVNQGNLKCSSCNGGKVAISFCYVCRDYLCLSCDQAHRRLRSTRDHRNILLENVQTLLQRPAMCSQEYHQEEPLNRYCQQCLECVCRVCRDESHRRHVVVKIEQAAQQGKLQISEALAKAKQEIAATKDKIKENSDIFENRKEGIDAARRNVEAFVNVSIQSLKKHKKAVLTELDDVYAELQRGHATKQRELQLFVSRLRSPVMHAKSVFKRNCDVEIVKERQVVINRCEDLLSSEQNWQSFQFPFVKYVADEEMFTSVRKTEPGHVIMSNTDPSRSTAHGSGLLDPLVDTNTSFRVVTRDSQGNQCFHENDQVKVKIQNPMGEEIQSTFTDKRNGKYRVGFTPECVGQYEVNVTVNGQPLTDSPWSVQVMAAAPHHYQRVFQLGSKGYEDGSFCSPCGIAICKSSENIAVADKIRARITFFSPKGQYLRDFGERHSGYTKNLKWPYSVAFSASGEIIIVDSDKMTFCSSRGHFVKHAILAAKPDSVSVSTNGKLIVCDKSDAEVKVLSPEGTEFIMSISSDPDLDGQPSFAILHGDKFFVSYPKKHCVEVLSDDGDFLYDIGAEGCDEEKLNNPLGLAVDRFNNLVVCDSDSSRLQVYKLDGRHVATVEGESSQLASPQFVAVSQDGHLFVTDAGKGCVHVFF